MTTSYVIKLNKWDVFDSLNWKPHQGQVPVLLSPARNRVVAGGRRLGKSEIGGHELIPEALLTYGQLSQWTNSGKRREFWIVGPEYSDSEKEFRVLYNGLSRLGVPFEKPGTYNDPLGGNMHISLWGGKFLVSAKSAKHPETLVGEGLSGVILSEAAKLKERVWTKFLRPTLADFHGWALFASTPEGKNWFYNLWQAGQDPINFEWDSWRMPAWMNPFVYPLGEFDSEILSLERDLSRETFNQEIGASFTEFVGSVFKEFDEEVHVGDFAFNPAWRTYAACDYGFTNPFVWLLLQIDPWENVYVLDEFYQSGLTISEIADQLQLRGLAPDSLLAFYPDPASPGETRELSARLRVAAKGGTGGELKDRLESMRAALKRYPAHLPDDHPDKKPKLVFNRRCVNCIREFQDYRYPKSAEEASATNRNAPEAPVKKDDHTPEALGRFYAGHYGPRAAAVRRGSRVRKSKQNV